MKSLFLLCMFLSFGILTPAQKKIEADIDFAYQNAKKGIYWALSSMPEKKSRLEKDIITDDKLIAHVKLEKEFNGVRVQSKGYYLTNTVEIVIYRSLDSLKEYGYLKEEKEE